jgi:hypothetical protein
MCFSFVKRPAVCSIEQEFVFHTTRTNSVSVSQSHTHPRGADLQHLGGKGWRALRGAYVCTGVVAPDGSLSRQRSHYESYAMLSGVCGKVFPT